MRLLSALVLLLSLASASPEADAGIVLSTTSAVVWSPDQTICGTAHSTGAATGTLVLNGATIGFPIVSPGDSFAVPLRLRDGENTVVVRVDSAGTTLESDTLRLTLGYRLRPEVQAWATVTPGGVTLHATVLDNPDSASLSVHWSSDPRNPVALTIAAPGDTIAAVTFPANAPDGEYQCIATVSAADGDTVRARVLIRLDGGSPSAFEPSVDHARWIDSAIVYGITPSIFVFEGRFQHIIAKIPEIAGLGANTLWIQPVYATHGGGQGYDVVDYFTVRRDLGTAADLRALVQTAHAHGLRVLLDFVPNHSSIFHPYALHAAQHGTASHYYTYYQRTNDGAPYSQNYHSYQGFINYFWNELPNLDYENPEVRRMIIEAGRFWIENFDVDGYRVDVAWGVNARRPEFMREWRSALKRLKPDVLLLAEDKATWPSVFDGRFDAAYDWTAEESWISHWSWQTSYSTTGNPTIFNSANQNQRAALLRDALTNGGAGYHPRAKVFRFLENNDTFRFLATHDLARTRMAAALLFTLPGIPSIFNGQEIGAATHPYSTGSIFSPGASIQSKDQYGLFGFYQHLAGLRKKFPALSGDRFEEVPVSPSGTHFAFRRWEGRQNLLTVLNMGSSPSTAVLMLPVQAIGLDSTRTYFLTDQLTNEMLSGTPLRLAALAVNMPAYTARVFVLDTTMVTAVMPPGPAAVPGTLALLQNYPNPFNPLTTIGFDLPHAGAVRLVVYDLVGRVVATPVDGTLAPGHHAIPFAAGHLASGVYFYRLETAGQSLVRKMLLLR